MDERPNRIHPELIEIERAKRIREEEEKIASRDDVKVMNYLDQEHRHQQGMVALPSVNDRYADVMQKAEAKVMHQIGRAEKRLEQREAVAVKTLHHLMMKRPQRIVSLLTAGKAMKMWRKAVAEQEKAIARIRSSKSTVHRIRTQQSHYRNAVKAWIRSRAIRIDSHIVREHEAEQERARREVELQRIAKLQALSLEREKMQELPRHPGMAFNRAPVKS